MHEGKGSGVRLPSAHPNGASFSDGHKPVASGGGASPRGTSPRSVKPRSSIPKGRRALSKFVHNRPPELVQPSLSASGSF